MGAKRNDHSSLIERMSYGAMADLLAPIEPRSSHPVTSVIELRKCPRCQHYLTARGRASNRCDECGAFLSETS